MLAKRLTGYQWEKEHNILICPTCAHTRHQNTLENINETKGEESGAGGYLQQCEGEVALSLTQGKKEHHG